MALNEWTQTTAEALFGDNQFYKWLKTIFSEIGHSHSWIDKTDELNTALQSYCTFEVNESLELAQLTYDRSDLRLATGTTVSSVNVPSDYIPTHHIRGVFSNDIYFTLFGVGSTEQGNIGFGNGSGSATTPHLDFQIMWHY